MLVDKEIFIKGCEYILADIHNRYPDKIRISAELCAMHAVSPYIDWGVVASRYLTASKLAGYLKGSKDITAEYDAKIRAVGGMTYPATIEIRVIWAELQIRLASLFGELAEDTEEC